MLKTGTLVTITKGGSRFSVARGVRRECSRMLRFFRIGGMAHCRSSNMLYDGNPHEPCFKGLVETMFSMRRAFCFL